MLRFDLRRLMEDANISISALSEKTGVSRKTLSQMVNNDSKGVQLTTLESVMNALNVGVDQIIVKDRTEAVVSLRPVSAESGLVENISDNPTELETAVIAQAILLHEKESADAVITAVLTVTMNKTPEGNLMVYVFPAFREEDIPKNLVGLAEQADSFINFIHECKDDDADRVSANLLSVVLKILDERKRDLSGIDDKSTAIVTWARDGEKPAKVAFPPGAEFYPYAKHLTSKIIGGHDVTVTNADLTEFIKRS